MCYIYVTNMLEKLVIKMGGNMKKDLRKVFLNPKKYAQPGTHTVYLKNTEELHELFSPKRLEMLLQLIEDQPRKKTISETAKELKRKQEAISRDAAILEKYELIKKVKEKQKVYLKPTCKTIEIELSNR